MMMHRVAALTRHQVVPAALGVDEQRVLEHVVGRQVVRLELAGARAHCGMLSSLKRVQAPLRLLHNDMAIRFSISDPISIFTETDNRHLRSVARDNSGKRLIVE